MPMPLSPGAHMEGKKMIDTARPEPQARLLPDRMSLLGVHRFLRTRKTEASITPALASDESPLGFWNWQKQFSPASNRGSQVGSVT